VWGAITVGSNPTADRSKLGTKRHSLTDKDGMSLSAIITSANTHDVNAITDVTDNIVIKQLILPIVICNMVSKCY
jgi:hypothetical protein